MHFIFYSSVHSFTGYALNVRDVSDVLLSAQLRRRQTKSLSSWSLCSAELSSLRINLTKLLYFTDKHSLLGITY